MNDPNGIVQVLKSIEMALYGLPLLILLGTCIGFSAVGYILGKVVFAIIDFLWR